MGKIDLKTGRQIGRNVESMRRYHGDNFIMYELAASRIKGKVLDIACGTGVGTTFLSGHTKEVVGVDIDDETIAYCLNHHKRKNLRFIKSDATKRLPFKDKSFDTITTFETIEHLYQGDRKKYLKQLLRVLKDDGTILLSTPQNGIDKQTCEILPSIYPHGHKLEFHLKLLKKELNAAGFEIIKEGGILYERMPMGRVAAPKGKSDRLSVFSVFQMISKIVPEIIKERIAHPLLKYPYDIKRFSYTEKKIDKAVTFYLTLKKKRNKGERHRTA